MKIDLTGLEEITLDEYWFIDNMKVHINDISSRQISEAVSVINSAGETIKSIWGNWENLYKD